MENNLDNPGQSNIKLEFADIDVSLVLIGLLVKMNIRNLNISKIKKYIYDCKKSGQYERIFSCFEIDEDLNSMQLKECYSFLKLCRVLAKNGDTLYINDNNFDYDSIFVEYHGILFECEQMLTDFFKKNPEEFSPMRFFDYYIFEDYFKQNDLLNSKKKKRQEKL